MLVLSLDIATRTGWAHGRAGSAPMSGAVKLDPDKQGVERAAANLGCFLRDHFQGERPDLIVVEHWMQPALQPHQSVVISSLMLAGAAEALAGIFGIPVQRPHPSTVRKHFIGKGRLGDREATNAAVLQRAIALRYLPRDCKDWDRANAVAMHDFASAHYARRPTPLKLFEQP